MILLTFIVSIAIAAVAAWYSIAGLTAIFSGAVIPVIIMGSVLEIGKLVTASWLYRNWRIAPKLLKAYLTFAVAILMLITSMGIFGFLSKAYIEQTLTQGGNNELQIQNLERQIRNEIRQVETAEKSLSQMDAAIETLISYDRIRGPEGSIAVRQTQQEERDRLNASINAAYGRVEEYQQKLLPLQKQNIALEAEVGPIKYIAELIYQDSGKDTLDKAVRGVIILVVLVFDPLAVILLIAANISLERKRKGVNEEGKFVLDPDNVSVID